MIRVVVWVASLALVWLPASAAADPPVEDPCGDESSLRQVGIECNFSADETRAFFGSGDGHVYVISEACAVGGQATCQRVDECFGEDGSPGFLYDVFRDGELFGQACLSEGDVASLGQVTPALVRKEFERLTWPSSELAVQPPDGVTLVGFDSNFFTSNTAPTTQTVTLLGKRIQIEATPTSYVWHFGDETTGTTTTPGAAYPQLLVTHRYAHTGLVKPSVDTVYAGRYRVGTGPWQAIPGTLTVSGQAQQLEVREARGVLVGH